MLRSALVSLVLSAAAVSIHAQTPPPAVAYPPGGPATPTTVPAPMLLWPNGAPGAQGDADEDKPTLTAFIPAQNPTRAAVVVAPGGGYTHLATEKEGTMFAQWLNAQGVAAFVLKYRLGPKYHHPIEIGDAQRAIRTVRARAAEWGIDKGKVGMMGSSAGGHLAASTSVLFDDGLATGDSIDHENSRPDFVILCYPVIRLDAPYMHSGSRKMLLGETPDDALVEKMSLTGLVNSKTPPTFLYTTTDDKTVPVMNSVLWYEALVKAGIPVELHAFQHGSHGSGLAQADPALREWPNLLLHWLQANGWAAKP
ncbi:alpha/beta hydrolase [Terriglobus albidus]|uniref:alpha/beta hydrolase n=1 Tax=Terriglobus albidus TaxID=1592106 RepID=UPI0021DFF5D9|nr:alpha/beta hydrolase [Terriglobus albidus]